MPEYRIVLHHEYTVTADDPEAAEAAAWLAFDDIENHLPRHWWASVTRKEGT